MIDSRLNDGNVASRIAWHREQARKQRQWLSHSYGDSHKFYDKLLQDPGGVVTFCEERYHYQSPWQVPFNFADYSDLYCAAKCFILEQTVGARNAMLWKLTRDPDVPEHPLEPMDHTRELATICMNTYNMRPQIENDLSLDDEVHQIVTCWHNDFRTFIAKQKLVDLIKYPNFWDDMDDRWFGEEDWSFEFIGGYYTVRNFELTYPKAKKM